MAEGGIGVQTTEVLTTLTTIDNIRDITKCSQCQHLLHDPKTLQCLHSCCNECLAGIEEAENGEAEGYKCPQCQRFTKDADICVSAFLVTLVDLERASKSKASVAKCGRCKTRDAKWFCTECKNIDYLCEACKENHDEYTEHKMLSVDEMNASNYQLNKAQYCPKHTKNEMDVVCLDCDKLICLRCKVERHDKHESETIADAVKRISPGITKEIEGLQENIKLQRQRVNKLEKEKEAAIEMYNKQICEHENEISEQDQVVAWAKTVIVKTSGPLFLQQFQDELCDRMQQLAARSDFLTQASRIWPWKMNDNAPRKSITVALPSQGYSSYPFTRIAILWDRIWMINHDVGIVYIFDFNGEKVDEFQLDKSITKPRTAISAYSGQAVIAAESGLFLIDAKDKRIISSLPGDYSDVCFGKDGFINALEYRQGVVVKMQIVGASLKKIDEIELENYRNENSMSSYNYVNTLTMTDTSIFIAFCSNYHVQQYTLSGKKVKTVCNTYSSATYPQLCGAQPDGEFFMTNLNNTRVEWWGENQKLKEYPIGVRPWFAVYQNNKALWILDSENKLSRYVHD